LGIIETAIKMLKSQIKKGTKNPLLHIFLIHFQLIRREHNNIHFGLDLALEEEEMGQNFKIRRKELSIQSKYILLDKKGSLC
jgi:hypothetical protein